METASTEFDWLSGSGSHAVHVLLIISNLIMYTLTEIQLAVDLWISTLGLQKFGVLESTLLEPFVGSNAFTPADKDGDQHDLTTVLELYGLPEKKLVMLQLRAPVVKVLLRLVPRWFFWMIEFLEIPRDMVFNLRKSL
jgi:hypothetical protein